MLRSNRVWYVLAILVPIVTTGCGEKHPGIVPVSGTVTVDGEPLKFGQVRLSPQGHRASVGAVDENGRFSLSCFQVGDGAPTGTHVATVTAVENLSENSNRWHAPKKYANQVQSGLMVTIDGPTDDLKIELTWAESKQSGPFVERF